jgi:hypothetical protein
MNELDSLSTSMTQEAVMRSMISLVSHPNRSGKRQPGANRRRIRFEDGWLAEFEARWWDDDDDDDVVELELDLN